MKEHKMWSIISEDGYPYALTWFKRDSIEHFEILTGFTWRNARKRGFRAVKTIAIPQLPPNTRTKKR